MGAGRRDGAVPEPAGRAAGPPRARQQGLTLIELLLVMSLLSVLFGVGLGMLSSIEPGQRAAVGVVQNVVRSAANTALARGAPARVDIDLGQSTITAQAMRVIGTWHFEDESFRGAFDLHGACVGGGRLVDDGYLGKALSFYREPAGSKWEVQVQNASAWDLEDGFSVELAVRQEENRQLRLLTIGESFALGLTRGGGVQAFFVPKLVDANGRATSAGRIWLRTEPGVLRIGSWERLRILYDRHELRIDVNGVQVAGLFESAAVWKVEGPLIAGGGELGIPVSIDALTVSAMDGEHTIQLADGVHFAAGTPERIQFAAGGGLDLSLHRTPAVVLLEHEDGRRERVQVSLYGTVE